MLRHRMRRVLLAVVLAGGLVGLQAAEAQAHPVPNDDFDKATVVDTLPFTAEQDTAQATSAPDDPIPSCVSTSHTVWYTGTAPSDLSITIDTFGSDYDTTLSVWTGERGALTELACNDDTGGLQSQVTFDAPAGEPVYLMVGSFGESPGGNLVLNIYETQFPANDDFDNATVVDTLPFTTQQDTALATSAPDDPVPSCVSTSHTVWFVGTAPSDLSITIDTFGSDYDTTLSVWTGERGALTELACNDDTGGTLQSQVTFDAPAGEPVYLMVGSFGESPGGNLVLNVDQTPPPGPAA